MEKLSTDQHNNKIVPVDFRQEERNRWEDFSVNCFARMANTCTVSQEYCNYLQCFARQILYLAKGFI